MAPLALDIVTGVVVLLAGAWAFRSSRTCVGWALLLTGAAWFAGSALPALALLHRPGLLAAALLSTVVWATAGLAGRAALLVGCAATSLPLLGLAAGAGAAVAAWAWLGRRDRYGRRGAETVLSVCAGLYAATYVLLVLGLRPPIPAYDLAVCAVALAAAGVARPPTDIGRLTIDLSAWGGVDSFEERLQDVLQDPTLRLALVGDPLPDPTGDSQVTPLQRRREVVGYLSHRPGLVLPPRLLTGLGSVVAMTVDARKMREAAEKRLAETERAVRLLAESRRMEAQLLASEVDHGPVVHLRAAARSLASSGLGEDSTATIIMELHRAIDELRVAAGGQASDEVQRTGLVAALRDRAASSPVPVDLVLDEAADRIAPEPAYVVLLFCAEGLANAVKHSGATTITITVTVATGGIRAVVRDDGSGGVDVEGPLAHRIGERAHAVGGSVTVTSPIGEGTTLTLELPRGEVA